MLPLFQYTKCEQTVGQGELSMKEHIVSEAYKAAPPVAVSSAGILAGLPVSEMVGLATIGYICLQAAFLIWKWRKLAKGYKLVKEPEDGRED
jgi:hypothetical protein